MNDEASRIMAEHNERKRKKQEEEEERVLTLEKLKTLQEDHELLQQKIEVRSAEGLAVGPGGTASPAEQYQTIQCGMGSGCRDTCRCRALQKSWKHQHLAHGTFFWVGAPEKRETGEGPEKRCGGGAGGLFFRRFLNSPIDRQIRWLLPGGGQRRTAASLPLPLLVACPLASSCRTPL